MNNSPVADGALENETGVEPSRVLILLKGFPAGHYSAGIGSTTTVFRHGANGQIGAKFVLPFEVQPWARRDALITGHIDPVVVVQVLF